MNRRRIYQCRFSPSERTKRAVLWAELYDAFLSQFIKPTDTILDIGAGSLEFLRAATGRKKIAVDPIYTTMKRQYGIFCYQALKPVVKKYNHAVDVVMLSNVLEHVEDREEIFSVLTDIRNLLKPDGSLLIIQPTIDLTGHRYWDFFDHIVPITRKSLQEVLALTGFRIELFVPRFLPYTTKTQIPLSPTILRLYLSLPWFLRPFAGQCFVRAKVKK